MRRNGSISKRGRGEQHGRDKEQRRRKAPSSPHAFKRNTTRGVCVCASEKKNKLSHSTFFRSWDMFGSVFPHVPSPPAFPCSLLWPLLCPRPTALSHVCVKEGIPPFQSPSRSPLHHRLSCLDTSCLFPPPVSSLVELGRRSGGFCCCFSLRVCVCVRHCVRHHLSRKGSVDDRKKRNNRERERRKDSVSAPPRPAPFLFHFSVVVVVIPSAFCFTRRRFFLLSVTGIIRLMGMGG